LTSSPSLIFNIYSSILYSLEYFSHFCLMRPFLQLNRQKLAFAFRTTALIFLTLPVAAFLLAALNGYKADAELVIIVLLCAGIPFPAFILLISYLAWYQKREVRRKAFSIPPYSLIHEIGFRDALLNESSRWSFTEVIKQGRMNGFYLLADVQHDRTRFIEIRALVAWKQLGKEEFKQLQDLFKTHGVEFDMASFVKRYDTKRPPVHSIQELKQDLEQFTALLQQNGFRPEM
jgi:hypothetical protein